MKFTIFKRMASAYALIMVMVIFMGIYVTLKLNQLTAINHNIARVDGAIISIGEQLLESLFSQAGFEMKYLISGDPDFYQEFNSKRVFFKEYFEAREELVGRLDGTLRDLIKDVRVKRDEKVDLSSRISHRAIRVTVGTAALTIVLGILISFYITRSIGKPISLLRQKTREIATGRFHKIPEIQEN